MYNNMCNSADDLKTQYVSIRRVPGAYDHVVSVYWEITYNPNYIYNYTNSTHTSRRRQLLALNGTNSTSNATTDIGINPTSGVVFFNESEFGMLICKHLCVYKFLQRQKIGFIIAKQAAPPGGDKYKWYTLNITQCNSSLRTDHCTPVYPSVLRMKVDITGGGDSLTETKTQKEMPKWLWWLIGGLVIFAAILALLGYRYWWKHKQTSNELLETEDELEHALEENELGFGRDLGVGDVQFNPMATGVPGQAKAPELFGGELDKRGKDAANVRADVAVEKFAHREQFGQQQGMKRGGGGNDLSQPLLG
ncbi:hypothetical protein RFI_06262 [Reticulomyxa filosa]|uniref:Uncharacterized protein n=1 Tax=Reticulomyxa filosa TaxID=46433 RepID=X6NYB6_RETFI|nr:hypothetical protein RFI_06262 [Reticulomyxa filosa]|eukprot:ETO30858.1 hypothetical protein RFI_06262 [Reticulomyxa filosa]